MHILPITQKGNHTMKFGQLQEYNMKTIEKSLKNHTQNLLEKLFTDLFLKN